MNFRYRKLEPVAIDFGQILSSDSEHAFVLPLLTMTGLTCDTAKTKK
jgi:hypothetical protein